jgi:hypothetical protein
MIVATIATDGANFPADDSGPGPVDEYTVSASRFPSRTTFTKKIEKPAGTSLDRRPLGL